MSSEMLNERLDGVRAAPAAEDPAPADELAARPSRVFAGDLEWKPPAAPNHLPPAVGAHFSFIVARPGPKSIDMVPETLNKVRVPP